MRVDHGSWTRRGVIVEEKKVVLLPGIVGEKQTAGS
jgi:hypothetical protein